MSTVGFDRTYGFFRSLLVKPQVAIIAYHHIGSEGDYPWSTRSVTTPEFVRQMRYLKNNFQIISLDELSASLRNFKDLPSKTAVVTFDDGYKDFYLNAYPVLKEYGIPATVFLVTGHIGTGKLFWFDRIRYIIEKTELSALKIKDLGVFDLNSAIDRRQPAKAITNELKNLSLEFRDALIEEIVTASGVDIPVDLGERVILSWREVKEMSRNGVNFGAHTVSHPILTRLPLEAAQKEILDSKMQAEKMLEREVTAFCYPNGEPRDFNADIEEILKDSGFKCAVTLEPAAFVQPEARPYSLPRIAAVPNFHTFEFMMSGLYSDLGAVLRRRVK